MVDDSQDSGAPSHPGREAPEQEGSALDAGLASFRLGRYFDAHQHFARASAEDPESIDCLSYLGFTTVALRRGKGGQDVDSGLAMLHEAQRRNMELPQPRANPLVLLGRAYGELGDADGARIHLREALELAPEDPFIRRELERIEADKQPGPPLRSAAAKPRTPVAAEPAKGRTRPATGRRTRRLLLLAILVLSSVVAIYPRQRTSPPQPVELAQRYLDVVPLTSLERVNLGWNGTTTADWPGRHVPKAAVAGCQALAGVLGADRDETIQLLGPDQQLLATCRGEP